MGLNPGLGLTLINLAIGCIKSLPKMDVRPKNQCTQLLIMHMNGKNSLQIRLEPNSCCSEAKSQISLLVLESGVYEIDTEQKHESKTKGEMRVFKYHTPTPIPSFKQSRRVVTKLV